jgi:hypothetical protein
MKLKGKADKDNVHALLYGTAAAVIIALLVPVTARPFYRNAGFSVAASLALSFAVLALAAAVLTCLALFFTRKKSEEALRHLSEDAVYESAAAGESDETCPDEPGTGPEYVDTVQNIDKIGDEKYSLQENVEDLLDTAMYFKKCGNYAEAVSCYRRALGHIDDDELLSMVIVDLCSLAKMTNNTSIIHEVLESDRGRLLDSAIKHEILNNI